MHNISGINPLKSPVYTIQKRIFIPLNHALTRMNIRFVSRIVIPVVVGSSPISHPNRYVDSIGIVATDCVAHCAFI
jgi:hypothetical protein